jgi:uncharacterized repeat protein (TIGR04138 family)
MTTHLCPACSAALPHELSDRCPHCRAILRVANRPLPPGTVRALADQVARSGYPWDAFEFVLRGLPWVHANLHGRLQTRASTHAGALCWGLIYHARHRFGPAAASALASFGLTDSADIGRVVYALVAAGLLRAEPADRPGDFTGVLHIPTALATPPPPLP